MLDGTAVWDGLNGSQHTGEIAGEAKPSGNTLHYVEGSGESACTMDLRLIGDYILAADSAKCGGLNARFGGVWRRTRP
ncbi:MAG TPA: hypothetical protein VKX25_09110 [Bryobacteraceae bacterium]|jgi:hypothetical protein|nr:hypothetical protein [Bryobacteraceae bacterium]